MGILRTLATSFAALTQRKLQEELDIWRLYHLLHYFQLCGGKEIRVPKPKEISFNKQYYAVHTAVTSQVIVTLAALQTAISKSQTSDEHVHPVEGDPTEKNRWIIDDVPFQLKVIGKTTSVDPIPGVRLKGHAVPGTVLCFFPGTVYLPPHVKEMPNYPDVSRDNPYLMSRSDGSIIDAKGYSMEQARKNSLAVGHLLKHPLEGEEPNVMPFSYEVAPSLPLELVSLVPNKYFKSPGFLYSTKSPMRSLVLVAMRHIKNEELLLNYRLHPDSQLPDWYTAVNREEDRRRWRY